MPPSRAKAIAKRYSETVSIAALMTGILRVKFEVRLTLVFALRGRICEYAGTKSTSSYVNP